MLNVQEEPEELARREMLQLGAMVGIGIGCGLAADAIDPDISADVCITRDKPAASLLATARGDA